MSNPITQIILNPHAAGGRAGEVWANFESGFRDRLGEFVLAITQQPEEVLMHLEQAVRIGLKRVVSIGGDGTNHALVNALVDLRRKYPNNPPLSYGMLPVGTGRDWARSQGIPFDFQKALDWLATATPHPTDIGLLKIDATRSVNFLNIASAGLGGEVDARVNRVKQRRPWTFLRATVESIIHYTPQHMRISVDGIDWFDDRALVAVVANGTTFGHGMRIAPEARIDDGLFDVVVIAEVQKLRVLRALRHVYTGTHLQIDGVHFTRGQTVTITSDDGTLDLDLDGEYASGQQLQFSVQPGLLHLLR